MVCAGKRPEIGQGGEGGGEEPGARLTHQLYMAIICGQENARD
jgi:hypothetical protein